MRPVDIEAEVITALAGLADSVASRVPNPRPATTIRVTRAGGNSTNVIQSAPRVLVECWADDSVSAANIAADAIAALSTTYGLTGVWGGRFTYTGFTNLPDPETEQARYQFLAQITTGMEDPS